MAIHSPQQENLVPVQPNSVVAFRYGANPVDPLQSKTEVFWFGFRKSLYPFRQGSRYTEGYRWITLAFNLAVSREDSSARRRKTQACRSQ
jgi:hypothetical protein